MKIRHFKHTCNAPIRITSNFNEKMHSGNVKRNTCLFFSSFSSFSRSVSKWNTCWKPKLLEGTGAKHYNRATNKNGSWDKLLLNVSLLEHKKLISVNQQKLMVTKWCSNIFCFSNSQNVTILYEKWKSKTSNMIIKKKSLLFWYTECLHLL